MNVTEIKKQFPIFTHHPDLVYLDSAATSQKPRMVIDRMVKFYSEENANIHRGIYDLAEVATAAYEESRQKIGKFINANSSEEIVFTKGTTEAINLVASVLPFKPEDEIVVTEMEHHSNLVPWQRRITNYELRITNGGSKIKERLKFIPITEDGLLDISTLPQLITSKTKIAAFTYISNVLGAINPVKEIVKIVKSLNPKTLVLIDAAQAVPHIPVDVQALGADFLIFSGHKMLGPTGIGVLWGRREILEALPPYQFGGSMISKVLKFETNFAEIPRKFEAGTPNIAGVIGLGAAIDFLAGIGMDAICRHEETLTAYALERLQGIKGVTVFGPKEFVRCEQKNCAFGNEHRVCKNRLGILSFTVKGIHAHDVAQMLDESRIAVRAGHHCAMPLHKRLDVPATARASVYLYNTKEDIDRLVEGMYNAIKFFIISGNDV